MFIVPLPLRIAHVLDQQIRTKTWNSLREIYFFSQQKSVPFGKGGGSQYGLTSPGWTWKAVERKTNVSKWKKSLLLARLTRKDYERVYRPKLYNYIATYTFTYRSHCSRFRWNLYPQKSQITTPNINNNSVVQKGSVELLHSRITRRHKGFELTCMAYSKNARALSRLLFIVKANVYECHRDLQPI